MEGRDMKLVDLLKHHKVEWPRGAIYAVQDYDGGVKFARSRDMTLSSEGVWIRWVGSALWKDLRLQPAVDWGTAIVARGAVEAHPPPEAHPHAEMMLQYAQDAMTTTEPHLLWQRFNEHQGIWKDFTGNPSWDASTLYRRKPPYKLIHGV